MPTKDRVDLHDFNAQQVRAMPKMGRPPISVPEKLRERLEQIQTYCLFRSHPGEKAAEYLLTTQKGLVNLLHGAEGMSDSHFRDVLANRAALRPTEVGVICKRYAGVTPDMLTMPSFDEFNARLQGEMGAQRGWIDAKAHYEAKRAELAPYIRPYYRDIDDEPDFPLLTKDGWLLSHPFELTPNLPGFSASEVELIGDNTGYFDWRHTEAAHLPGTHVTYADIKRSDLGGEHFKDAPVYRLVDVELREGKPHRLRFDGGWYFEFINKLEVLGVELAERHREAITLPFDDAMLPLRGKLDRAFELGARPCAAGLNTLLIALHDKGHVFYMHKREAIGEAPNIWHVVPSGTFQPERLPAVESGPDPMLNYSLWRTAFRELGEEVLGVPELEDWPLNRAIRPPGEDKVEEEASWQFIKTIRNLASENRSAGIRLEKIQDRIANYASGRGRFDRALMMTKQGKAKLFYLGCGLDPVSTKPELLGCLVLDLRDERCLSPMPNFEGKVHAIPLSTRILRAWWSREDVLPAGQACLRLVAHRHLGEIMGAFGINIV